MSHGGKFIEIFHVPREELEELALTSSPYGFSFYEEPPPSGQSVSMLISS